MRAAVPGGKADLLHRDPTRLHTSALVSSRMRLSGAQVAQFDELGYLHLTAALTAAEIHAVTDAFEETLAPFGAGVNVLAESGDEIDRSGRTQISAAIQRHPQLCSLLDHPAVVGLIGGVIGSDFNYTGACSTTSASLALVDLPDTYQRLECIACSLLRRSTCCARTRWRWKLLCRRHGLAPRWQLGRAVRCEAGRT